GRCFPAAPPPDRCGLSERLVGRIIFQLAYGHSRDGCLPLELVELLRQEGQELDFVVAERAAGLLVNGVIISRQKRPASLVRGLDGYERDKPVRAVGSAGTG